MPRAAKRAKSSLCYVFFTDLKGRDRLNCQCFICRKVVINICVKILAAVRILCTETSKRGLPFFAAQVSLARQSLLAVVVARRRWWRSITRALAPPREKQRAAPHLSRVGGRPKHLRTRKLVSEFGDQSGQQRLRLPLINFICPSAETRAAAQIPESQNMIGESALTRVPAAR